MKTGFSNRMKDVFTFVREEVIRLRHSSIRVEHLFLGILRDGGGSAIMVLKNLDVDPLDLKIIIENTIKTSVVDQNVNSNEISFSKQAERVLKKSILETTPNIYQLGIGDLGPGKRFDWWFGCF